MKRLLTLAVFLGSLSFPSLATWNLANTSIDYCGTSSLTCAVNFNQSTTGSMLVAVAFYNGTGTFTTASTEAGNWIHPAGCSTTVASGQTMDFMYTLSGVSASTTTFNFSSAAGFADIFVLELKGASPFTYGSCSIGTNSGSSTSINAGSITTTGSSSVAIAASTASADWASAPTVSAPFTSSSSLVNGQEALATALNIGAQTTQAVFTAPSAVTSAAATLWFTENSASVLRKRVAAFWTHGDGSAVLGGGGGGGGGTPGTDFLAQAVADEFSSGSTLATNEGHPHGVPSTWDFYSRAFVGDGNNPCNSVTPCNTTMAMTLWGIVYADANGNPATNTRVEVKACKSYWYSSTTQAWTSNGAYDQPQFGDYQEDYGVNSGDFSEHTSNTRSEGDGGISVKPASGLVSHFYAPFPRMTFPKAQFAGLVNVCQMRLVVDNGAGTDDRPSAKLLGGVGGDFYPSASGSGIDNNPGIGGGRLKYISTSWRSFAVSTLTYAQIKALPSQPPVDLTGLAP